MVWPGTASTQAHPGAPPAVLLFGGADLSHWVSVHGGEATWKVEHGYMEAIPGTGDIRTQACFGDCQLHLEWAAPTRIKGEGQERGNSGVLLMGVYELQVLDGYQNPTYADGVAAAIYGQYPPLVNACRQPGEWLCYDIIWMTPRFEGEQVVGLCHDPAQWHCGAQPRRPLGAHPASAGSRVSPAPAERTSPAAGSW